jgi:REP element-mobilizing transposase RayT
MEEIGRKHPIHLDVHDRRDTPIIVFLTVCTKGRKPILASSEAQALLIAAWRTAKKWRVGRYVIMPDHIHLFCAPAESETSLCYSGSNIGNLSQLERGQTQVSLRFGSAISGIRNCAGARVTIKNGSMSLRIQFGRAWLQGHAIGHTKAR